MSEHLTTNDGRPEVKATAENGKVQIELPAPMAYGLGVTGARTWASAALTVEQADELVAAISAAQLVAVEQRVRNAALGLTR